MSSRLHLVGKAPAFEAAFGPTGALRENLGRRGRVHIDRALPFIVLHRGASEAANSLARHVALTSPAYMIWSGPTDDAAAIAALKTVVDEQRRRFGHVLAIVVDDLPRPAPTAEDTQELPAFRAEIGASANPLSWRAASALGLESGSYLLVTLHRPALVDGELLGEAMGALAAVAAEMPVVFPVHPRIVPPRVSPAANVAAGLVI